MKTFLFCLSFLTLFGISDAAFAQDDAPKFDGSFQLGVLRLEESVGEAPLGVGGRFGYRFSSRFFLDGEAMHFPEDPSGNFGETLVLGGIRYGKQFDKVGIYAKARAGAIHFGGSSFNWRLSEKSFPVFDVGAMLEFYPKEHFFIRLDLGDCIIPFGGAVFQGLNGPVTLETRHTLAMGFGFGFRF